MTSSTHQAAPGSGVAATWNYTLGSILFLFLIMDLLVITELLVQFSEHHRTITLVVILLALVAGAVRIRWSWFLQAGTGSGVTRVGWTIALVIPAVASWVLAFFARDAAVFAAAQLWFSGVLLACLLPRLARWVLIAGAFLLTAAPVLLAISAGDVPVGRGSGFGLWFIVAYGAMLPMMLLTSLWLWRVVTRLDEARRLAAELAVTQERLRFAADLHDIQGHHLQVIALKAELAERTMLSQPELAATQVGEIRVIAKEALEETRSLVAGLRQVALADELENAREVLTLAGTECTLRVTGAPSGSSPRQAEVAAAGALAFAVREATTNILRHSSAGSAEISLAPHDGGYELVVMNDGVPSGSADPSQGSGLAGLKQRVAGIGGTLSAGPKIPDRGAPTHGTGVFELRAWVPGVTA